MALPQFEEMDGKVFVRTSAGAYVDTRENFEKDFGRTLEAVPEGANRHLYEPHIRNSYMLDGDVVGGGFREWAFGDDAIAAYDSLIASQSARADLSEPELDMGASLDTAMITGGSV